MSTNLRDLPLKCTACGCVDFEWWVESAAIRRWQDAFKRGGDE
jgi:hypothetical protein